MSASSRKKNRKFRQEIEKELRNQMELAVEDGEDFFATATPFEISVKLSEQGVSTTHRAGVEAILDGQWARSSESENEELAHHSAPATKVRVDALLRALVGHWESERQSKGRPHEMEAKVFLILAAQHFVSVWTRLRLAENERLLGLTRARIDVAQAEIMKQDKDMSNA